MRNAFDARRDPAAVLRSTSCIRRLAKDVLREAENGVRTACSAMRLPRRAVQGARCAIHLTKDVKSPL